MDRLLSLSYYLLLVNLTCAVEDKEHLTKLLMHFALSANLHKIIFFYAILHFCRYVAISYLRLCLVCAHLQYM